MQTKDGRRVCKLEERSLAIRQSEQQRGKKQEQENY